MNPVHRFVWNLLMRRRRNLRFLAARFPWFAPWAVRVRMLAHVLVGNVHVTAGLVLCWWLWPTIGFGPAAWSGFGIAAFGELFLQLGFYFPSRFGWLRWPVGWREGWAVRAYLPAAWADGAAKTAAVQAEVGTSSEPTAPAKLRPVADHPKLSFVPFVEWPTVSFWVGPPPGRTFAALDEMADVLAANLPRCHSVTVEYRRATDSFGRISFTFDDVLEDQTVTAPPLATLDNVEPPAEVGRARLELVAGGDVVTLGDLPVSPDDLPESA